MYCLDLFLDCFVKYYFCSRARSGAVFAFWRRTNLRMISAVSRLLLCGLLLYLLLLCLILSRSFRNPRLFSLLRSLQSSVFDEQTERKTEAHHRCQDDEDSPDRAHVCVSHCVQVGRIERWQSVCVVCEACQPRRQVVPQTRLEYLCGNRQSDSAA